MNTLLILPIVWPVLVFPPAFRVGAEIMVGFHCAWMRSLGIRPSVGNPMVLWGNPEELGLRSLSADQASLLAILTWPDMKDVVFGQTSVSGSLEDGPEDPFPVFAGLAES